ncbi:MAG: hypothetical protein KAX49_00705 [Halanaerobiales bacterium]|nr:hypothetical protein [Halanaerobiales bacterium]
MHKGVYWSQVITGIGIGLILAALVWISVEKFDPVTEVPIVQPERGIVHYQEIDMVGVETPELKLPHELKSIYMIVPDVVTRATSEVPDEEFEVASAEEEKEKLQPVEEEIEEKIFSDVKLESKLALEVQKVDEEVWIQFVVKPGESAESIAVRLHKEKFINGKDFINYVNRNKLDRKLQFGIFTLQKGMEIEEIVAEFTR